MVIRIPVVVLVLGVATAIAQGRAFLGPIQGAPVDWLFVSLLVYNSVIPLVPFVFIPRGRLFGVALADADAAGEVTPALTAAFDDPVVGWAHIYEFVAIVTVFVLMITKPF